MFMFTHINIYKLIDCQLFTFLRQCNYLKIS